MLRTLLLLCFVMAVDVLADRAPGDDAESTPKPLVATGIQKLEEAAKFLSIQQAQDTKKKAVVADLCSAELTSQTELKKQSAQTLEAHQNNITNLEALLKTNKILLHDQQALLTFYASKAESWQRIQERTSKVKDVAVHQHDSFKVELQTTSDVVNDFLATIKNMQAQKVADKKDLGAASEDMSTKTNVSKSGGQKETEPGTTNTTASHTLESPLSAILSAIATAKEHIVQHHAKTNKKLEQFHKLVLNKVDTQSTKLGELKARLSDLNNENERATQQLAALRTAVESDNKHMAMSQNISIYFTSVCEDYVAGFTGRMEERAAVLQETKAAIKWFNEQFLKIRSVIEPEQPVPQQPDQQPVAGPCNPNQLILCGNSQPRERKGSSNQQALRFAGVSNPVVVDHTLKMNGPEQKQGTHLRGIRFRNTGFVPAYTNMEVISRTGEEHASDARTQKRMEQKEELTKQLMSEYDNQLQFQRGELAREATAQSLPVRVGYKTQGGA